MIRASSKYIWDLLRLLSEFFVPTSKYFKRFVDTSRLEMAVLIPTYGPVNTTYKTVEKLNKWFPEINIVVIDDATPLTDQSYRVVEKIKALSKKLKNVTYLRSAVNASKAGALNIGINYLKNSTKKPKVVFVFDDDIELDQKTLGILTRVLYEDKKIGAVCTQALVKNKNKNLLTRLQGLEYHNFNVSKIADNHLLMGPLVMQGMLTAFRMSALEEVGGFTSGHLIEDYDITARLKIKGWKVRFAQEAVAWTSVPEDLDGFWKQRVRWTFGGLNVVAKNWKFVPSVFQDLLGHTLFISLLGVVFFSLIIGYELERTDERVLVLLVLISATFLLSFAFNLFTFLSYPRKDKLDFLLKISILPEFFYSNLLSIILVGSYLYFVYVKLGANSVLKSKPASLPYNFGLLIFRKLGYSNTWGTKNFNTSKGGVH